MAKSIHVGGEIDQDSGPGDTDHNYLGKDLYKLGRDTAVYPAHGVARVVTVSMREPAPPYQPVPPSKVQPGVQRVTAARPGDGQGSQVEYRVQGGEKQDHAVQHGLPAGVDELSCVQGHQGRGHRPYRQ